MSVQMHYTTQGNNGLQSIAGGRGRLAVYLFVQGTLVFLGGTIEMKKPSFAGSFYFTSWNCWESGGGAGFIS